LDKNKHNNINNKEHKNIGLWVKKQRLTHAIRFAASRRLGLHKNAVGLRPLCIFIPAHFARPGLASQAPIRAVKTSYSSERYAK
jgi:hypothetical protein